MKIPRSAIRRHLERPGIKPPAFVSDVYKDMRDRRLIVPAVALLIAIVAVPVLLASDPEPGLAGCRLPPSIPTRLQSSPACSPSRRSGFATYRERLDSLDAQEPLRRPLRRRRSRQAARGRGSRSAGRCRREPVGSSARRSTSRDLVSSPPRRRRLRRTDRATGVLRPRTAGQRRGRNRRARPVDVDRGRQVRRPSCPARRPRRRCSWATPTTGEFAEFLDLSRRRPGAGATATASPDENNCEFLRLADGEKALPALRRTASATRSGSRTSTSSASRGRIQRARLRAGGLYGLDV